MNKKATSEFFELIATMKTHIGNSNTEKFNLCNCRVEIEVLQMSLLFNPYIPEEFKESERKRDLIALP